MSSDMIAAFALEAEVYDVLPFRVDQPDVGFFVDLAKEAGGPVLELACGTGRITLPLARAAGEAVGLDLAPAMLGRARAKAKDEGLEAAVSFIEGDMCTARLDREFPLVMMGGQPLFFLKDDDALSAALETVRAHVAPGGRWAAGVPVLRAPAAADMQNRLHFTCEVRHPVTGQRVAIWDASSIDEVRQIATRRRITETLDEEGLVLERRHSTQTLYYRHPAELRRLIEQAGFRLERTYGGYDKRPFGSASNHLIWVATKED